MLFTRYPDPGSCKTRLIPAVGPSGAADIHRHLTERTIGLLLSSGLPVTVAITGAGKDRFEEWLGSEVTLAQQAEGGLSDRLRPFVDDAPVILFGSDTPDLQARHVKEAIQGLSTNRVVIGPAEDGGYYLIAMRDPLHQLITDMPWSTERVFTETMRRLDELGIEPLLLETLADCDRPEDLERWPDLMR